MPQSIVYDVTVNGKVIPVTSDHELTDYEAYALAKQQLQGGPMRTGSESYGRPVSDTGQPYQDLGTQVQDLGQPLAHPQTFTDFGHLLFAGADATRTTAGMAAGANTGRQMLSDAARTTSGFVQPPLTGAPSRILEWLANRVQPRPATSTTPAMAPPSAPTPTTPSVPAAPVATEAATQLQASPSFRGLPTHDQIWADQAPTVTATRTTGRLAAATEKFQAAAQAVRLELTPDELDAGARLVMEGIDPAQIAEALARQKGPAAFSGLPSNADVEANKYFPKMGNPKGKAAKLATKPKGT